MHPATRTIDHLLAECEIRRQRRSGPGGQHRNKVETGIFIRHQPTGIDASATERRSQEANRQVAIGRLRVALAISHRELVDLGASPSELWLRRRAGERMKVSREHDDFAAVLAEALDVVAHFEDDLPAAANHLGISTSQLIKLLRQEPAAFVAINRSRAARGLHAIK